MLYLSKKNIHTKILEENVYELNTCFLEILLSSRFCLLLYCYFFFLDSCIYMMLHSLLNRTCFLNIFLSSHSQLSSSLNLSTDSRVSDKKRKELIKKNHRPWRRMLSPTMMMYKKSEQNSLKYKESRLFLSFFLFFKRNYFPSIIKNNDRIFIEIKSKCCVLVKYPFITFHVNLGIWCSFSIYLKCLIIKKHF